MDETDRLRTDNASVKRLSKQELATAATKASPPTQKGALGHKSKSAQYKCVQLTGSAHTGIDAGASGTELRHIRPYRSHRYPACARCHKRRSRCTIEKPGQPCRSCKLSGSSCSSASSSSVSNTLNIRPFQLSQVSIADADGHAQVLGPVVSRDTQVLESIVSDISSDNHGPTQANGKPFYRSGIVSRRPSLPAHLSSRDMSTQLFQQVNPYMDRLVALYFEELHPCLPMMDERSIWERFTRQGTLHSLFLTTLIAYTSFYWNRSPALPVIHKPNQDFAWDVATMVTNDNSQKGDMFAIIASVLNVAGRPSKGVVSNMCSVARATALSHSIGLNHSCGEWDLAQPEKDARTKLWWAVVVHDRWFHFAQGTPPYINTQHYNVPLPTMEMLIRDREMSTKHIKAAECFIRLCKLTEIVGDVLPLVYHIRSGNEALTAEQISRTEEHLATWLSEGPSWMSFNDFEDRPLVPGFANLQFSYLAVQMLIKRIAWHENPLQSGRPSPSRLLECLESAKLVAMFLSSLQAHDLAGFWLPYHAQHFTSAVTLLLRCALQIEDAHLRRVAMAFACQLVDRLKAFYDLHAWDLAEIVLPQTESILSRIRNAVPATYFETGVDCTSKQRESSDASRSDRNTEGADCLDYDFFDFADDAALEDMFPELFTEFTDNAFFESQI